MRNEISVIELSLKKRITKYMLGVDLAKTSRIESKGEIIDIIDDILNNNIDSITTQSALKRVLNRIPDSNYAPLNFVIDDFMHKLDSVGFFSIIKTHMTLKDFMKCDGLIISGIGVDRKFDHGDFYNAAFTTLRCDIGRVIKKVIRLCGKSKDDYPFYVGSKITGRYTSSESCQAFFITPTNTNIECARFIQLGDKTVEVIVEFKVLKNDE